MNSDLMEALSALEKEKKISKDTLIEAIENSLLTACKNHYGKADNFIVKVNPDTGDFSVVAAKEVVENVEDDVTQISLAKAKEINSKYDIGDTVNIDVKSAELGRIAIQIAKNVILQKIREEERRVLYDDYYSKEKDVMTGVVQRYAGRNLIINLGRADAVLNESEMVKGEHYKPNDRIKVYVVEVKDDKKDRVSLFQEHIRNWLRDFLKKKLQKCVMAQLRLRMLQEKPAQEPRCQSGPRILTLMR